MSFLSSRQIVALVTILAFAACSATCSLAAQSQVWLVDTRCAPGCGDLEAGLSQIYYWRLSEAAGCSQWQAADAAALAASADPSVPTVVLVHGYGTDADWAVQHGNQLRCEMQQVAGGRPYRLIVWSWPADRMGRGLRGIRADVQGKVGRSDAEAYYLARTLSALPHGEPLSLIGYSLGCRTTGEALTLLAGGTADCRTLPPEAVASWSKAGPRPIRMMLLAAATDCDFLAPCAQGGMAAQAVERILVTENSDDRALRLYSRLYGRGGPPTLGSSGPCGAAEGRLELVDVTCEVGRKHDYDLYVTSPDVFARLGWYTFLCGDAPATAAANGPQVVENNRAGK